MFLLINILVVLRFIIDIIWWDDGVLCYIFFLLKLFVNDIKMFIMYKDLIIYCLVCIKLSFIWIVFVILDVY